jgi:hypothetical protein
MRPLLCCSQTSTPAATRPPEPPIAGSRGQRRVDQTRTDGGFFDIDLDDYQPRADPQEGVDAADRVIPAVSFPYRISETDPELFLITVDNRGQRADQAHGWIPSGA